MKHALPPYGLLTRLYDRYLSDDPMDDWQGCKHEWTATYQNLLDQIKTNIWPVWDADTQEWEGASDKWKDQATKLELELMMTHFQKTNVLDTLPSYNADIPNQYQKTHRWHFEVEDNLVYYPGVPKSEKFSRLDQVASLDAGYNYVCYDPMYNPERFASFFFGKPTRKIHGLFDFKKDSMRPRPYQAAAIFGLNNFSHFMAKHGTHTGTHPSLISGHSVQGILLSCMVLETWLQKNEIDRFDPANERLKALAQYAVDFGDRRVFAGVHYPSDNIASWFVALSIIPRTFCFSDQIIEFARYSIKQHSRVYQHIDEHYTMDENLQKSVALLNTVLENNSAEHA